jgi:hypothetical protein
MSRFSPIWMESQREWTVRTQAATERMLIAWSITPTVREDALVLLKWAYERKFHHPCPAGAKGGLRLVIEHSAIGAFSPISFWSAGTRDDFTAPCIQIHIDPYAERYGWPDDLSLGLPEFVVGLPERLAKRRSTLRRDVETLVAPFVLSKRPGPEIPLAMLRDQDRLERLIAVVDQKLFNPRRP